jgi:regulatory protein
MIEKSSGIFKEAVQKMKLLCSKQERCTKDIEMKLAGYNLSEHEIRKIIMILSGDNYINDERFSKSFTHDKLKFNKWGKIKIKHQLKLKGISDNHILKALESINEKEYLQIIKSELIKKHKRIRASNVLEIKNKLIHFGHSKGFETDLLFQVANELVNDGH